MICPGCGEFTSWRYKRCGNCNHKLPQPDPNPLPEQLPPPPPPMPGGQ